MNVITTNLFRLAVCLVLQLSFIQAFSQTVYYVDGTNGNNSNNGLTPGAAWKTIQKAGDNATRNSTVLIRGGTYKENVTINVSGAANEPIVFKAYPQESVFLDGTGTSGTTLLTIVNQSYLTFEGITLQNLTKNNAQGILVECEAGATMTTLAFRKLTVRNIRWTTSKTAIPGDNDNAQPFIVYGRGTTAQRAITNLVVDSCEFYDNIPGYSEVLSIDANVDGFTITNNRVHDNINIGIYAGGNYGECTVPALDHARNGLIEKNTCYRNTALYATSGGIYVDGAMDVIVRRNTCYENGYGIEVGAEEDGTTERITVINNLFYNNEDAGIAVGGYTTETTGQVLSSIFRNNTLLKNDSKKNGSGEFYVTKASQCVFQNNIVFAGSENTLLSLENISPQTGNTFNYNVYYTALGKSDDINVNWRTKEYSDFGKYKTGTSQDANSRFIAPGLISATLPTPNLQLNAGSAAIDMGNPATTLLTNETDFGGQPRLLNSRIDIGAYEGLSTSGTVTTSGGNDIAIIKLNAFPNPAQRQITIQTTEVPGDRIFILYNVRGEEQRRAQTRDTEITWDINTLPGGVYLVRVLYGAAQQTTRVVVANRP
ncbi:right-handed parallel beta-helix repeat-containing protein [Fulvivirgaceae bacterium PWU5]|uniref:Right-handed parallel beta-helix repeat-containing protein n=1 Tax=Dawidia cretensis TaxID=2782350 RepID=A0AAP2E4F4_9BACT|nr:right-handed parallel beta-helix repeat-containing protein [Dawidia cretensis]MBT1711557.1 right-handed parallel beta-helix repeat-containing protein [Dawidia cretensis]